MCEAMHAFYRLRVTTRMTKDLRIFVSFGSKSGGKIDVFFMEIIEYRDNTFS
jgi:hypothetical protein